MLRKAPLKPALVAVLAAVLLLPGLLYSFVGSANPFVYFRVARAEIISTTGCLLPVDIGTQGFNPLRLGTDFLLTFMSQVTGLAAEQVQYLPLGLIITVIAYLALMKRITRSNLLAYLVAFSIAFDGMMATNYDAANVWSWTHTSHVIFILALLHAIKRPRWELLLTVTVLYAGVLTLHVPVTFWTIMEVGVITLLAFIVRTISRQSLTSIPLFSSLMILFIGVELAIDDFLRYNVRHFAQGGYFQDFFIVWLPTVIQKLFGQVAVQQQYLFASPLNPFTAWVTAIKPLLYTIPIGIYLVVRGFKLIRLPVRKWPASDPLTALLLAITFVGIINVIAYLIYGGNPSLRYMQLMYPAGAVIALYKLGVKRVVTIGVVLSWCLISVVGTAAYLKDFPRTPSYHEVKPIYSWLQQYSSPSPSVLTGLETYGKLTALGVHDGNLLQFRNYTVEYYGFVVEDDKPTENRLGFLSHDIDYVIITTGRYKNNPVTEGNAWRVYEPLSWYTNNIENNAAIARVYDDGIINAFVTLKETPERRVVETAGSRIPP